MKNIVERVALYADIDTRRALGVYRKLPKVSIERGPTVIWRYWPEHKKAIFFTAEPLNYEFEVHEGLVFDGEYWTYTENSCVRSTTKNKYGRYYHFEYKPKSIFFRFGFGINPEFIDKN